MTLGLSRTPTTKFFFKSFGKAVGSFVTVNVDGFTLKLKGAKVLSEHKFAKFVEHGVGKILWIAFKMILAIVATFMLCWAIYSLVQSTCDFVKDTVVQGVDAVVSVAGSEVDIPGN